ncbi:MAG TPA: IS66 family transposase [Polyangiaceae bacterium]|nr:IS66 family transposase [Polyangiaceae bacterium]
MAVAACSRCAELSAERDELVRQVAELSKLVELQGADLERLGKANEELTPNQPERVPRDELQLVFEKLLESIGDDDARRELEEAARSDNEPDANEADESQKDGQGNSGAPNKEKRKGVGRRRLDMTSLPLETVQVDPDEVIAVDGVGFELIGVETSERVAFRPASYFRLQVVRRKWARTTPDPLEEQPTVLIPDVPDGVWPGFMADPSAIARVAISKYDDLLPLNRQQRISHREGFVVPKSTACGWLGGAYDVCARIVGAMDAEARARAYCIATDSTSAPVRQEGGGPCTPWSVFVLIADLDHVIFRYAKSASSAAITSMLEGFEGYVLADAALIYDALFKDGAMKEVACWAHMRRYFFKALGEDSQRAMQALALISKLFLVGRMFPDVPPNERTHLRAKRARPILAALDAWVAQNKSAATARGKLGAAIRYYENQREALHRFLDDGRLRLDNNPAESALRKHVLGRANWVFFENETGLKYFTVFRSILASCALHDLNPHDYLEACCGSHHTGPSTGSSSSHPSTGGTRSTTSTNDGARS